MTERDNLGAEAPVDEDQIEVEEVERGEAEVTEETGAREETSELEKLREKFEETKAQADRYLEGWQRTQAEFSNYKKRQRSERAQIRELANASLLRKLLPVLDDFERAIATMPDSLNKLTWSEGVQLIKRKLDAILTSEGVERVETEGRTFDPKYHEAVTHEEIAGYEEGQIIDEVQPGYVLDERVLRPALVRVAKAPAAQPKDESTTGEGEE